jgi:hypothetical protein
MIVMLSCMAVALCFVSFGLGIMNLASPRAAAAAPPPSRPAPVPAPPEARKELEKADRLRAHVAAQRVETEELKAAIEEWKKQRAERQKELEDAGNRLATLQSLFAVENGKKTKNTDDLMRLRAAKELAARELAALRERIKQARGRVDAADKTIAELEKKIPKAETVIPWTTTFPIGSGQNPQFVECVKDAVVLQPQGQSFTLDQLKKKSAEFVQAIHRDFVAFGVRPEGFQSFNAAHALVVAKGLKVGYRPVEGFAH